mmetsp:Transcript_16995/g.43660  ORF Transcript_16995/g.43660 Transcript_16995/m.43660 type:complete len:230 (-) Transcript_16995:511-1200(-)
MPPRDAAHHDLLLLQRERLAEPSRFGDGEQRAVDDLELLARQTRGWLSKCLERRHRLRELTGSFSIARQPCRHLEVLSQLPLVAVKLGTLLHPEPLQRAAFPLASWFQGPGSLEGMLQRPEFALLRHSRFTQLLGVHLRLKARHVCRLYQPVHVLGCHRTHSRHLSQAHHVIFPVTVPLILPLLLLPVNLVRRIVRCRVHPLARLRVHTLPAPGIFVCRSIVNSQCRCM